MQQQFTLRIFVFLTATLMFAIIAPKAWSSAETQATSSRPVLSLTQIMAEQDWFDNAPQRPFWHHDSQSILYQRQRTGSEVSDLWRSQLQRPADEQLVELAELHRYGAQHRVFSADGQFCAWIFQGNIFYLHRSSGRLVQLSRDNYSATQLQFLTDGKLAYQLGYSWYVIDPTTGSRALHLSVDFSYAKPADIASDYLAQQQIKLSSVLREQQLARQQLQTHQQQLQQQNNSVAPQPFYFPDSHELAELSLSPNGRWAIAVIQVKSPAEKPADVLANYMQPDGRMGLAAVRPPVTDGQASGQQLWLLDLNAHQASLLSYTSLPGYNEDVLSEVKKRNAKAQGQRYQSNRLPRKIGLVEERYWPGSAIQWHSKGSKAALMLEATDNKDRWLVSMDVSKPQLISEERLHSDAWIAYKFNQFGWLNHSETLYYLSEKSGYSHLYLQAPGGKARALTEGSFEVDQLSLSADDGYIYFRANQRHPGQYDVFRVNLASQQTEALTQQGGISAYQLSPDETKLLLVHSTLQRPPELFVYDLATTSLQQQTHSASEALAALAIPAAQIIAIDSAHSQQAIYARLYQPEEPPALQTGYKAVVFAHGAGFRQNAFYGWSAYQRDYLFHQFLAQQGYVVLDVDYRASAGYGREWRSAIYRHMGKAEVQDLRDAVDWLVKNAGVDRKRVGIYGSSYGGYLTLMAMFTAPELFAAGAAQGAVTDWAYYNYNYSANILNTPDVDPLAYQQSSAIYFVDGLQKPLLICAPMLDDNVLFQDSVRLVQRLIELRKNDFEIAIYPLEKHAMTHSSSWLDQYRRIYTLFEARL